MSIRSVPADALDVLIVGGGVIALAIAESLASEGMSIRIIEAEAVGSGASGAAAGMLAPISEADLESPMLSLGLSSLERFESLCARLREETGIDPEFERSGLLHLARTGVEAEALAQRFRATQLASSQKGWVIEPDLEWLDGQSLRDEEPELDTVWSAGFFSPHEAHLRPPLFVRALAESAQIRGVRIDSGIRAHRLLQTPSSGRVIGVETSIGSLYAGVTILAAGAWTPSILEASGIGSTLVGIEPVRGQILALEPPLPPRKPICWSKDVYFVPKRDGTWIVGATEERAGFDRRVTAEGVAWLLDRARSVFPSLAAASFGHAWAGLRPVSVDGLPSIGRVPDHEGLWIAAGHGRNGVLLAPITAQAVHDDLLGKVPNASILACAPGR